MHGLSFPAVQFLIMNNILFIRHFTLSENKAIMLRMITIRARTKITNMARRVGIGLKTGA